MHFYEELLYYIIVDKLQIFYTCSHRISCKFVFIDN